VILLACSEPPPPPAPERLEVVSLSRPVHWLVQRIAGDAVDARCLLPEGEDAGTWRPDAATIASLSEADLLIANGAGFEAWTNTASLPRARFVDTSADLDLLTREAVVHSHGADGKHSHGGVDPHTWMDPALFAQQADAVHAALLAASPDQAEALELGHGTTRLELDAIDSLLATSLQPWATVPIATSHPTYSYLARRFGLHLRELDLDPAQPVTTEVYEPWLWWEVAPSDTARASVEGPKQLVFDSLEGEGVDWLAGMRANIDALGEGP